MKPDSRIQYENWYNSRFGQWKLLTSHAFGAWYGWIEGYKKGQAEARKEIELLKKQLAELEAK